MRVFEEMQKKCCICCKDINGANTQHHKIIVVHGRKYPVCDSCVENANRIIHTKYETIMKKYRFYKKRKFHDARVKRGIS